MSQKDAQIGGSTGIEDQRSVFDTNRLRTSIKTINKESGADIAETNTAEFL
jgi:hypothetical protein